MSKFGDNQQQTKNKNRLIAQNKKLYNEINILELQMSAVLEKRAQQAVGGKDQATSLQARRSQLAMQQKYIKKLKKKIQFLKSTNAKGNAQYIRKQQDDLSFLKAELKALLDERQTRTKLRDDKLKALNKNQPLDMHKSNLGGQLDKVRKQNRDYAAKITNMERQIRKYHQIFQLSKAPQFNEIQNPQFQIAKIDHSIQQLHKKMRDINQKWQPQFSSLDTELFYLKDTLQRKQNKLKETEKQYKNMQIRMASVRNQTDVIMDRDRVANVPLLSQNKRVASVLLRSQNLQKQKRVDKTPQSPKKIDKKSIQKLKVVQKPKLQKQKQEIKQLVQQNKSPNLLDKQARAQKTMSQVSKNIGKPSKDTRSQAYSSHKKNDTNYNEVRSQRQWKLNNKLKKDSIEIKSQHNNPEKKQKKLLKNIGVGTSFYLDQN